MARRPRGTSFSIRFLWPKYPMLALRTPPHSPVKISTRDVFVDIPFDQAYSKLSVLVRSFNESPESIESVYREKPWKKNDPKWTVRGIEIGKKKYVLGRIELRRAPPSTRAKFLIMLIIHWSTLLRYLEDLAQFLLDIELKDPNSCGSVFSKLVTIRDSFLFNIEKSASDVLVSPAEKHAWEWFLEENKKFYALLRLTGDYYSMKNILESIHYTFVSDISTFLEKSKLPWTSTVFRKLFERNYHTIRASLLKEPFSPDLAAITLRRLIDLLSALLMLIVYYRETYREISGSYTLEDLDQSVSVHLSYLFSYPTTIKNVAKSLKSSYKGISGSSWFSMLNSYLIAAGGSINVKSLGCFWKTFSSFVHAPATPQILSVAEYKLWIKVIERFRTAVEKEYLIALKQELSRTHNYSTSFVTMI